jgi:Ser/Thr protein kinase RdoA (MazF antagonist)
VEAGGGSYVCYLSLNLRWIRDLAYAHRFLQDRGLSVPRMVASATGAAEVARQGTGFVLREYQAGVRCDLTSPLRTLRKVAGAYAALHRISADRWGHPRGTRRTGPLAFEHPVEVWRRTIHEVQSLEGAGTESAAATALQRLVEMRPGLPDRVGYRLVHGDSNLNNILLASDGQVYLIDLEGVHFGFPPLEVTHLLLQLCGRDPGRWTAFLEAYLDALDPRGREAWEKDVGFWLAGGLLTRVGWQLRRYRVESAAGPAGQRGCRLAVANRHWQAAKRVLEAAASGSFDLRDAAGSVWEEEYPGKRSAP